MEFMFTEMKFIVTEKCNYIYLNSTVDDVIVKFNELSVKRNDFTL
jgi:hypothetical protein